MPLNQAFTTLSFVLSLFEKYSLMDAKFESSQVFKQAVFLGHVALFLKPLKVTEDNVVCSLVASHWMSWLHRNQPSWTGLASHLSQWNALCGILGPVDGDALEEYLLELLNRVKNDVLVHTKSQPLDGIRRAHSAQITASTRALASTSLQKDDNSVTKASVFLQQLKNGISFCNIVTIALL
jgi:hypothetical protein